MARPVSRLLPRLTPGRIRGAAALNAACLLGAALGGAGLVHLLAYHVPLDIPLGPRWGASALALLLNCPLRVQLALCALVALLAVLLARWETRRLEQANAVLARLVALSGLSVPVHALSTAPTDPDAGDGMPRSPLRLAGFVGALLGLQVGALALAGALWPMRTTMVMGDGAMVMPVAPPPLLGILHLLVAVVLGLSLWRVERRLTWLRRRVAARLRLLARPRATAAPRPSIPRALRWAPGWDGLASFARPPPAA